MNAAKLKDLVTILGRVRYKNWKFRLCEEACVNSDGTRSSFLSLRVGFMAPNVHSKLDEMQWGRRWLIDDNVTPSQLVATAFKAVITAEEHEARELFAYREEAIFGPHYDVDGLAGLSALQKKGYVVDKVKDTTLFNLSHLMSV